MARRALIMAGGGLKVAFQAGVLQVWLDEAKLTFDDADGASGGCFNLAMYAQGLSGTEIADNWRLHFDPVSAIDLNWRQDLRLLYAESLLTYDRFREHVLPAWRLDWEQIRAAKRSCYFNAYNFSRHELRTFAAREMSEDHLIAAVSLPIWFPPITIEGDRYIDAVYVTDANIEAALDRGADELWIIWTVSTNGEWNPGFVAEYFQIIEAAANGRLRLALERIERSNKARAAGEPAAYDREIVVRLLEAEVPVHYLVDVSADRIREAVERGVAVGRRWCLENGFRLAAPSAATEPDKGTISVGFREVMKGSLISGDRDPRSPTRPLTRADYAEVSLAITIADIDRFIAEPEHEASMTGTITWTGHADQPAIEGGVFNLFVDQGDPTSKQMRYQLTFTDDGAAVTLSGVKYVHDDPGFDLWSDTSTLYCQVCPAGETPEPDNSNVLAAGVIRIHLPDFLRQLTTFRAHGGHPAENLDGLARFGRFFLGSLWDVYGREILANSPI
jgi:predicted acylesterase/phospholipase RssA